MDKHVSSDHGHSLVDSLESTKPVKSPKTKASKTALKRKNLMNNKGKKKIYRPTMINDGDTIDRDVEIVESLLTDTDEEQINGTDEKDTDWGKFNKYYPKLIVYQRNLSRGRPSTTDQKAPGHVTFNRTF